MSWAYNLVDHLYRLRKEEDQLLTLEVCQNLEASHLIDCLRYAFALQPKVKEVNSSILNFRVTGVTGYSFHSAALQKRPNNRINLI